ncbi:putative serine/cysteine trypsin-like peptidase [Trypanosoma rangeli]|uniref:Putative serine/cysteine trypsin-like peptidase n=1 Tax=Trypanosoma rangeli TaxID=5698 RepID=A0A422MZU5_TRYRA|nr:putative serine/cysteine trypsin-like peptidase [Trypanosoma rangeli]RNE98660.1 putative serine/cysteine trypsin-like peptidase [Trypanosoma rangeli]|eukprot:RNE98660.1 putative serine/cysteine trypsin-like peptidase [Trypanosoma rangeli]
MTTVLTSSNRRNIPAVCRIRGRGTAILVSPGILLTSRHVISTPEAAAQLTAVFFEGSKKKPVEVRLRPQKLFFAAFYPDYMDYCLVGCEEYGIFNVTPVDLPLTQKDWAPVREGDIILVVQHPIWEGGVGENVTNTDNPDDDENTASIEVKRFEEVLRCRNDLFYLKANGDVRTAGCPAFNECGQLIGLQSQLRSEGEGVVNRVVSIASVVRHLFANKMLRCIQQKSIFEDVWSTWYLKDDISRIVLILENFEDREIARATAAKLCEHTCFPNLIGSTVASGGIQWILFSLNRFNEDIDMVSACIRAMWNVSFEEANAQRLLVEGGAVDIILGAMEKYPTNEEIAEFSVVVLYNFSTGGNKPDFSGSLGHRALVLAHAALQRFKETTVLQKFGFSFFTTLLLVNHENAETLVKLNIVEHTVYLAEQKQDQVFLMEALMNFVGELAQHRKAIDLCFVSGGLASSSGRHVLEVLTSLLIDIMFRYQEMDTILLQGNRALWGIGNDMTCRAMILQHPRSYDALKLSLPALVARARVT